MNIPLNDLNAAILILQEASVDKRMDCLNTLYYLRRIAEKASTEERSTVSLIDESAYMATVLISKDDISSQLQELGIKPTEELLKELTKRVRKSYSDYDSGWNAVAGALADIQHSEDYNYLIEKTTFNFLR